MGIQGWFLEPLFFPGTSHATVGYHEAGYPVKYPSALAQCEAKILPVEPSPLPSCRARFCFSIKRRSGLVVKVRGPWRQTV